MIGKLSIAADGSLSEPASPLPAAPPGPSQLMPAGAAGGAPGLRFERSWPSPLDAARRYGVAGDRFYKIALPERGAAAPARRQDLFGEAAIMCRCRGIPGIPEIIGWRAVGEVRMLITRRLDARPLSRLEVSWGRLVGLQLQLAILVVRLAWRGVSHDDLRPENILVDGAGRVHLVDFDQASSGSFAICLARSMLGLGIGRTRVSNAFLAPLRERVQECLPPALLRLLKGRRNRTRQRMVGALPRLPPEAGAELRALYAAWRTAAASSASSPGCAVAYYALEFGGLEWPGERPWAERWRILRPITAWRGRRVLELGCNLGLLSISLLREEAIDAALAVDRDARILAAGAMAARAFGVRPEFRRVDFDRVADRARLLAFLGRCDEVIYEGHDSVRVERRRLRAAGFTALELIATSERGRPVFRCRKLQDP
jgi:hypothetical protein